jgi:hypothetical protein
MAVAEEIAKKKRASMDSNSPASPEIVIVVTT